MPTTTMLLGRDAEEPSDVLVRDTVFGWALGISAGTGVRRSAHRNEDACGIARDSSGRIRAIVADAHHGREAAEILVQDVLQEIGDDDAHDSLRCAFRRTGKELSSRSSDSETAAVAVLYDNEMIRWVAVGDCACYLVPTGRPRNTREISPVEKTFLGRSNVDFSWGTAIAERGDRIVLASDGLPECIYGTVTLRPASIGELACARSPLEAVHALLNAALAHGGQDNVAVVVGQL